MCRHNQLSHLVADGSAHGKRVTILPRNGSPFVGTIEKVNTRHGSALLQTEDGIRRSVMLHTLAKPSR